MDTVADREGALVNRAIAKEIRGARNRAGMTMEEVADAVGKSLRGYGRYEKGERDISVELLARISWVIGIRPDDLWRDARRHYPEAFAALDPIPATPLPLGEPDEEPDDMPEAIPLPNETEPEEEARTGRATRRGTAGR